MACESHKIDSNITGLAFAEEECLKLLPVNPVWYNLEPNSYSDFGGEVSTVARSPIDPSRQNKKGTITDLNASGGFNTDFTKSNLTRLLQGFFFADARELPTTKPLNGEVITVTGVDIDDNYVELSSGGEQFIEGMLVQTSGFSVSANNGMKVVVESDTDSVTFESQIITDNNTSAASLTAVGIALPEDDASIVVTDGVASLETVVTDFTAYPFLIAGAWVFVGGDDGHAFDSNVGFARIKSVTSDALVFDDVTWQPANESGDGKSLYLFCGSIIKNENDPALIKRRSYNIERTLGDGVMGAQAEYLEGAVANEFSLSIPQADKISADLSFVACDNTHRSGDTGDELKGGDRVPANGEDAYNTSSDIYRIKMSINSDTSVPASLFGYVSEASVSINNNVTPNKAVGVLGAFDTSAGNFEVSGSVTAYFSTVEAVRAVRNNADVGLSIIGAAKNAGFIFDIPLLGLGGGRLAVEKDAPITVPLKTAGAENANGYTLLHQVFSYLPNVAMPY